VLSKIHIILIAVIVIIVSTNYVEARKLVIGNNVNYRMKCEITDINKKLSEINVSLDKYSERIESAKRISDVQLQVFTGVSSCVIALVAICLGFGAYKIYVDHKRLVNMAENLIKENLESWKTEYEKTIKYECESIVKSIKGDLQDFEYFLMLRELAAKDAIHPDEIYPLLTPLVQKPLLIYKPIFNKIVELNYNIEITNKAKEGLSKI